MRFFLDYRDPNVALGVAQSPWWRNGESGRFRFTPEATNWTPFIERATNGVEEYIVAEFRFREPWGMGGSGGWASRREADFFGRAPDLIGCQVEYVDLVVHSVRFWMDGGLQRFEGDITWQFWGTVPEPASLISALLVVLLRRNR